MRRGLPVHPEAGPRTGHAPGVPDGLDRRDLFKFVGASLALAGASACTRQPAEKIVPYVRQPEEIVPGKPLFYATAMTVGGVEARHMAVLGRFITPPTAVPAQAFQPIDPAADSSFFV